MCAHWVKQYNHSLLLAELQKLRKIKKDGESAFSGMFAFQKLISVIQSTIDFHDSEIPETEQRGIVTSAIFDVARRQNLSPSALIGAVSKQEQTYSKLQEQKFTLLTRVSIEYKDLFRTVKISDHTLTFSKERPKKFEQTETNIWREKSFTNGNLPENYAFVRVSGSARSVLLAVENAFASLDLLRGIWNYVLNFGSFKISGGKPDPVNRILLGPLHTLHTRNGKLASDMYWYENPYAGLDVIKSSNIDWLQVRSKEKWVRKKLVNHRYKNDIVEALIRYTRVLDNRDLHSAFVGLWGILEYLTCTSKVSNEIAVRRTIFLFDEREFHQQVMKHLASFRNRVVHAGVLTDGIESLVYQLKEYVERLLRFHLINFHRFNNRQEAAMFLNLPVEQNVIQEKIHMLEAARKFRYGT